MRIYCCCLVFIQSGLSYPYNFHCTPPTGQNGTGWDVDRRLISDPPLGSRLRVTPVVCPSVLCLCRVLNVPTHNCADALFNWRRSAAAMAGSQLQACCVNLCTLSGRATIVSAVDQADTLYIACRITFDGVELD